MAVDRGYGSGKPRSAAQSAARRTAAAKAAGRKKTIKRQAANPGVRLGVSRVGKTENAGFNIGGRQYLETGVSTNKLAGVLQRMLQGDKYSLAQKLAVRSRIAAKVEGRTLSGNVNDVAMRNQSTSVFPRINSTAKNAPTLRQEYLAAKQGYELVFGRGSKMGPFNPDVAAMTSYPGKGVSAAKIRKISNQVDSYLAKRAKGAR